MGKGYVVPALLTYFLLLVTLHCSAHVQAQYSVAVVGSGVGGAFSATFLRAHLKSSVVIDVFEKGDVGGRTQDVVINGQVVELGASIFCQLNYYLRTWTDKLQLGRVAAGSNATDDLFAIFDGHSFVFKQSSWTAVSLLRLVWRYGLSYFRFMGVPIAAAQKFARLYQLQEEGFCADTPEAVLQKVELYDLTQDTFKHVIEAILGTGSAAVKFFNELLSGINRVNYNQAALNGLAGMVSMFPLADNRLFHVRGGNVRLTKALLTHAAVQMHHPAEVQAVLRQPDGRWRLQLTPGSAAAGAQDMTYDAVIIATPLENAQLVFKGFHPPPVPARSYQRTVTTIVSGRLQPAYFGANTLPEGLSIMVTADAPTLFSSIAPGIIFPNGTGTYKVFSAAPLSKSLLSEMFSDVLVIASHDWAAGAYPKFDPPEAFAPFLLAPGLIYNNAWENAASAMEMSAVAAANSALLVRKHLQTRTPLGDDPVLVS